MWWIAVALADSGAPCVVDVATLQVGEVACAVGPDAAPCVFPQATTGTLTLLEAGPDCTTVSGASVELVFEAPAVPEPVEETVEAPAPSLDWTTLLLAGLSLLAGVVGTLVFVRVRDHEPLPDRTPPRTERTPVVVLPPPRPRGIEPPPGPATPRAQPEALQPDPSRAADAADPADPLAQAVAQALSYPELRAACHAVADLSDTMRLAQTLLKTSRAQRGLASAPPDYEARWRELEDELDTGLRLVAAFAFGARHLDDEPDVMARIAGERPYRGEAGARAWAELSPVVARRQGDDGAALGVALKRQVVTALLVPLMRLGQLICEALEHELPGLEPVAIELEPALVHGFDVLGYAYEHTPLYARRERDFLHQRDRVHVVAVPAAEVLPGPVPAAEPGCIVRVTMPVIQDGPAGHTVRAQLVTVEAS